MEHGQQLPHHVKLDAAQNTVVGETLQFPDAGTQSGILRVQFLDALFQVDGSGCGCLIAIVVVVAVILIVLGG